MSDEDGQEPPEQEARPDDEQPDAGPAIELGDFDDPKERMREIRILAAYLHDVLGGSTYNVGAALDYDAATIRRWTKREDWDELCEIARKRWVKDIHRKARRRVFNKLSKTAGDDDKADKMAFDLLERLEPELAPREKESGTERQVIVIGGAPAGVVRADSDDEEGGDEAVDADYEIVEAAQLPAGDG